jgi:hypothetical protein
MHPLLTSPVRQRIDQRSGQPLLAGDQDPLPKRSPVSWTASTARSRRENRWRRSLTARHLLAHRRELLRRPALEATDAGRSLSASAGPARTCLTRRKSLRRHSRGSAERDYVSTTPAGRPSSMSSNCGWMTGVKSRTTLLPVRSPRSRANRRRPPRPSAGTGPSCAASRCWNGWSAAGPRRYPVTSRRRRPQPAYDPLHAAARSRVPVVRSASALASWPTMEETVAAGEVRARAFRHGAVAARPGAGLVQECAAANFRAQRARAGSRSG